jgi:thiamine-phosphate pyrophosphorylase
LPRPILCLVTDRRLAAAPLEQVVAAAAAAGVDWVQLRERDLSDEDLLALADRVRAALPSGVELHVSRRVDVALACGADGVQLGSNAMPVAIARRLLGDGARLGVSTHGADEVAAAARDGADHAQLAPIFAPLSKPADRAPLGVAAIRRSAAALPLLAQGGIDATNAGDVIRAGAAGVAVTGAILAARDPAAAARALRDALDRAVA